MTRVFFYNPNTDTIKKKKYAVEFASERAEGKTEGKEIGGNKNPREFARRMIIDGMPLQKVSRMTQLSIEIVQELAAKIGANFDEDA